MHEIFWLTLITGYSLGLLLTTAAARPTIASIANDDDDDSSFDLWEHVNKTCHRTVNDCSEQVNLQHLHDIQRYMNRNANPCENFHAYACGNWGRTYANTTTMVKVGDERINEKYEELFEAFLHRREREGDPDPVAAAKWKMFDGDAVFVKMLQYYRVCKDELSTASGMPDLKGYLAELRSEGLWLHQNFSLRETFARLHRYGYNDRFLLTHVAKRNVSYHLLKIASKRPGEVDLNAQMYDVLREYTTKSQPELKNIFERLNRQLQIIYDEICERNVQPSESNEEGDDECGLNERIYSLKELQQESSGRVNWSHFLSSQLGYTLSPDTLIAVDSLEVMEKYVGFMQDNVDGELRFLFVLWQFLQYLQTHTQTLRLENYKGLSAALSSVKRRCVRHMRRALHLPMNYVYERAFYGHERANSDAVIMSVFDNLKREFRRKLLANKMKFTPRILDYLLLKLHTLRLNIGNLPTVNNTATFYADYASGLNVTENFHRNHLNSLRDFAKHQLTLLTLNSETHQHPLLSFNNHRPDFLWDLDASPYYFCVGNIIIIPFAYLQPVFYDWRFWPALLYGDLANTLGHEMMHAVDSEFISYDAYGNFNPMYKSIFANEHFSGMVAELTVGTSFVDERIADIGGTRLALDTFLSDEHFLRHNGKLYFLQFAQFFCCDTDEKTFKLEDRSHDMSSLRLNYALSQMPEFGRVFKCPVGSSMNPMKKSEIW